MKLYLIIASLLFCISGTLHAQVVGGGWKEERALYAETKQVNQFFRRFNNEETVEGKRLYNGKDSSFRDLKGRAKYLKMLFDNETSAISKDLKADFISDVTNKSKPQFLDFHGGKWIAEVSTTFIYKGKQTPLTMFMLLQEEKVGAKWVISKIHFNAYETMFPKDSAGNNYFLHPLSHEVDFMNMHKVFEHNSGNIIDYTFANFTPDPLTLFVNDVSKGILKYETVTKVKFHFFQLNGWYFELSEYNRSGNNTGWLISALTKATESQKLQIENYLYHKQD